MIFGQELSSMDTLILSGMAVIMLELMLIAIIILVMVSKLLKYLEGAQTVKAIPAFATESAGDESEDEIQAVIMSVISEDLQIPLEELTFKNFKSL